VTPRGQSAYVASKFALRGFSDVLRLELFDHGVGVTTVYPGGVRTRIAANSRRAARVPVVEFEAGRDWVAARLTYSPERAAAEILAAVQRRRPRVLITQTAHLMDVIARLAPAGQAAALERIFGRGPPQTRPETHRSQYRMLSCTCEQAAYLDGTAVQRWGRCWRPVQPARGTSCGHRRPASHSEVSSSARCRRWIGGHRHTLLQLQVAAPRSSCCRLDGPTATL
jgi:hypothetical protein